MASSVSTLALANVARESGHSPQRRSRAVVTGGAGFIGSNLCKALLARGFAVECLDNFSMASPDNLAGIGHNEAFRVTRCDVSEGISVTEPVDVIFHCALPRSNSDHILMPTQSIHSVSTGTLNALEFARLHGCRFVLVSSAEVYGNAQDPQSEHRFSAADPGRPDDAYRILRQFAEALTVSHRALLGVDTTIVRIFNTYGPGMDSNGLVSRFIRNALSGRPLVIPGDGTETYSLCHVNDVVRGILDVGFGASGGPINVGDSSGVPVMALAALIQSLSDSPSPLEFAPFAGSAPRVPRPDTRVVEQLYGWGTTTKLRDGLEATIAAIKTMEPVLT